MTNEWRRLLQSLVLTIFVAVHTGPAVGGDATVDDSLYNRGDHGCGEGSCPVGNACMPTSSGCCDEGSAPAQPGQDSGPPCASSTVFNPIDMRNGNKFQREMLFKGGGEMPLEFALFYNSKHVPISDTGQPLLHGRWTYSYSQHLVVRLYGLGMGGSLVELRREDGQSLYFVEPANVVSQPSGSTIEFATQKRGDYGAFRGLNYDSTTNTYEAFEYTRPDRMVERYGGSPAIPATSPCDGLAQCTESEIWTTVRLDYIESPQGGRHVVDPPVCNSGEAHCEITVHRTLGGSISFWFLDETEQLSGLGPSAPPSVYTSDSFCYRCPIRLKLDEAVSETIFEINSSVSWGLIDSITYPEDDVAPLPIPPVGHPGDGRTKHFRYAEPNAIEFNDKPPGSQICSGPQNGDFWNCDTALTGLDDEEGLRWSSWNYREQLESSMGNFGAFAWAYEGYHGTPSEMEDHVLFSQPSEGPDRSRFRVQRNFGVTDVYNVTHVYDGPGGFPVRVVPRVSFVRDARLLYAGEPSPDNIELVNTQFEYYLDDEDEFDAGGVLVRDRASLVKAITVGDARDIDGPTERHRIEFDYDANRLVQVKRELEGPPVAAGSSIPDSSKLRYTEYEWDPILKLPERVIVSRNGTPATWDYEEVRDYDDQGRLDLLTITDHSNHSIPYVTAGRTRVYDYEYEYYDATAPSQHCTIANTCLKTITIMGPRGFSGSAVADDVVLEFTPEGYLASVELNEPDAPGEKIKTTWSDHNAYGQPQRRVDPDGVSTSFVYNARGWLRSRTRQGATWGYQYYGNGLVRRVTEPDGSWVEFTYTAARKLKEVENNFEERVIFTRTQDTTGSGVMTVVAEFQDPSGTPVAESTTKYDSRRRVLEVEGGNNQKTKYGYSLLNRLASTTEAGVRLDLAGGTVHTDLVTTYAYDGIGRLASVVHPKRDAIDPDETTAFTYSPRNRVTQVSDPEGRVTDYTVDGFGDTILVSSPDSGTTVFEYDEASNVNRETRIVDGGAPSVREFSYDFANRLKTERIELNDRCFAWSYDSGDVVLGGHLFARRRGRLASVESGTWNTGSESCDPPSASQAGHQRTDYGYDLFGRLERVRETLGAGEDGTAVPRSFDVGYSFDASGNLDSLTYPSGRVVDYSRASGRVQTVGLAGGPGLASSVTYFPFGPIEDFVYGNEFARDRTFDYSRRLSADVISHTDPGTQVVTALMDRSYGYDGNYDTLRMITDTIDSSFDQSFVYDQRHRLDFARGEYGDIDYEYDDAGNRTKRTLTASAGVLPTVETYGFATNSNRVDDVLVDDQEAGSSFTRDLIYDPRGNILEDRLGGFDVAMYDFDARNQLERIRRKAVPEPSLGPQVGALVIFFLAATGRFRSSKNGEPPRALVHTAVLVGALLAVGSLSPSTSFAQDFDGDQIPDAVEVASQSRPLPLDYQNAADGLLDFDGDGYDNTTEYLFASNADDIWNPCVNPGGVPCPQDLPRITEMTVDAWEILDSGDVTVTWTTENATSVEISAGSAPPVSESLSGSRTFSGIDVSTWFTVVARTVDASDVLSKEVEVFSITHENHYDADRRRVRQDVESGERLFVYGANGMLLSELDGGGSPVREYVYLDREPLAQFHGAGASEVTYFVHTSHLGTPEFLTAMNRDVEWSIRSTPFGETQAETPAPTPTGESKQYGRFPGQLADPGINVRYNWHRYYDPSLGRYISADPIGQAGGINVYNYALNDPVNLIDPLGLMPPGSGFAGGTSHGFAISGRPSRPDTRTDAEKSQDRRDAATNFGVGSASLGAGSAASAARSAARVALGDLSLAAFAVGFGIEAFDALTNSPDGDNDNDGIPDYLDNDDDNDLIPDLIDPDPNIGCDHNGGVCQTPVQNSCSE